jgi:uncharacterized caspase-like protein
VLTGSDDSTARIWDARTGQELARLFSFTDGTWAVIDTEGRFDASNAGDVEGLHWVVGLEPIALSQLKERYYEPGLLAKAMGFNDEPLREVAGFNERGIELFPEITVTQQPSPGDLRLGLRLDNRGGGIGRVTVLVNGKEVAEDARPEGSDQKASTLDVTVDLTGSPLLIPGARNTIGVIAYNAAGYLASRLERIEVVAAASRGGRAVSAPTASAPAEPPALWALVAGVSDYRAPGPGERDLDLSYAAKDAEDFATALEIAAKGHGAFNGDALWVRRLTDDSGTPATRTSLLEAFQELQAAKPTDILVVYLAGHGITWGDDYYYLLSDANSLKLEDEAVREQAAISSRELTDLIKKVPALKQVLVLDTCASGQLIADLSASRSVSSSQTRSLDRMKDRTGMFVLAGSAADAVSYEATEYGQGLLTYSLLEAMKGTAFLREGEFVDVQKLFARAVDRVPELAGDVGGVQQPRLAVPRGGESFDLGQLNAADRDRILLVQKRPLVLRTSFIQNDRSFRDKLKLGQAVDLVLREVASRGRAAPIVFVDADEFSNAYLLSGGYTAEGESIVLQVSVSKDDNDVGTFELRGQENALEELATLVVEQALHVIAQN